MMKQLLYVVFFFSLVTVKAQTLTFDHGEIEFYTSSVLSDIEAFTEKAEVKLDAASRDFEVKLDINSFDFEYDLMKEHFNEKYMETEKYPEATLIGKINKDILSISNETEFDASGQLTIHGVTRNIQFKVLISKNDNFTLVKAKFPIVFKDYNIDEPSILTKSVAKDVLVKSTLYLK